MSSTTFPNLGRRPSLAESIEVTVEEHTESTVLPSSSSAPFNLASYQFPSKSASVHPAPAKPAISPAPTAVAESLPVPFLGRRSSLVEMVEVTIEHTEVSSYSPPTTDGLALVDLPPPPPSPSPSASIAPPAYRFPPVSPPTLLSFYPSGGITRPKARPFSSPAHSASARHAPGPPPPPTYTRLPHTSAERFFYLGFVCPPLWLAGAWRAWHSAIPSHLRPDDHRAADRKAAEVEGGAQAVVDAEAQSWWAGVGQGPEGGEGAWQESAPRVEDTVALWREEELLWATRCAKCFGGAVVMGAMIATVAANVFR